MYDVRTLQVKCWTLGLKIKNVDSYWEKFNLHGIAEDTFEKTAVFLNQPHVLLQNFNGLLCVVNTVVHPDKAKSIIVYCQQSSSGVFLLFCW